MAPRSEHALLQQRQGINNSTLRPPQNTVMTTMWLSPWLSPRRGHHTPISRSTGFTMKAVSNKLNCRRTMPVNSTRRQAPVAKA